MMINISKVSEWYKSKHPRFAGLIGGSVFFCLSLTPSLLPRTSLLQGVASGITFAIGYGLGSVVGNIFKPFNIAFFKINKSRKRDVLVFAVVGLLMFSFMIMGYQWQNEMRQITESQKADFFDPFVILLTACTVAYLLVGLSRKILRVSRTIESKFSQKLSPKTAALLGGAITAILLILFIDGVVFRTAMAVSNSLFGYQNTGTPDGIVRLDIPEVSGSSKSSISWDSLGEKGREFIGKTTKQADVTKFTGLSAEQPIRIYSGLKSAPDQKAQIKQIIGELERTNAASRKVLLVANSTGSGGITPEAAATIEYMYDGSSASVGLQYSFLPSWISFLADKDKAQLAGKELFNGVYEWWSQLAPNKRPKLVVYGESLGAFGAEGAFSGAADMANRTNGMLLVGPPNSSTLWSDFVENRDSDSPQWQPVYQKGKLVRFADYPAELGKPGTQWGKTRVVYFQHASDPVVWWSPKLILTKPDWLKEPRGNDVIESTRWYPFVTFWQVAVDLPLAYGVPEGHGHRYGRKIIDGWAAILQPPGWSAADSDKLKTILY